MDKSEDRLVHRQIRTKEHTHTPAPSLSLILAATPATSATQMSAHQDTNVGLRNRGKWCSIIVC